jgi:hypothetical protein
MRAGRTPGAPFALLVWFIISSKASYFYLSIEGSTLWSAPSISPQVLGFIALTQENVGTKKL